ncbi:MAG: cyclic nucleotide-binding domain-containing protein, partial [Proteobacteria bacterium]|nr:cyclic nucleotide-binding domain-containing protein [Pseudomonadota bacterium]
DGEDESSKKAVADVIAMLPTKALKFGYLLDLCGTPFGAETESYIVQGMAEIVDGMTSAEDLVEAGAEQIKIIEAAAGIRDRLLSTALPDQWRRRFARRIYELLVHYDEIRVGQPRAAETIKAGPEPMPAQKKAAVPDDTNAAEPVDLSSELEFSDGPLEQLSLDAGDYLFREGDVGDAAYLVVSGQIELLRDSGEKFVTIAKAGPGSIIGEMAMLDAEPRMASARAVEDTLLTVIPMVELKLRIDRLEKYDPVLYRMVGTFVQRMRDYKIIDAE